MRHAQDGRQPQHLRRVRDVFGRVRRYTWYGPPSRVSTNNVLNYKKKLDVYILKRVCVKYILIMSLAQVWVINMSSQIKKWYRLREALRSHGFVKVNRFEGVDGSKIVRGGLWSGLPVGRIIQSIGPSAMVGISLSHIFVAEIIASTLDDGEFALILEDDAFPNKLTTPNAIENRIPRCYWDYVMLHCMGTCGPSSEEHRVVRAGYGAWSGAAYALSRGGAVKQASMVTWTHFDAQRSLDPRMRGYAIRPNLFSADQNTDGSSQNRFSDYSIITSAGNKLGIVFDNIGLGDMMGFRIIRIPGTKIELDSMAIVSILFTLVLVGAICKIIPHVRIRRGRGGGR